MFTGTRVERGGPRKARREGVKILEDECLLGEVPGVGQVYYEENESRDWLGRFGISVLGDSGVWTGKGNPATHHQRGVRDTYTCNKPCSINLWGNDSFEPEELNFCS